MAKRPVRQSTALAEHTTALKENTKALIRHSKVLSKSATSTKSLIAALDTHSKALIAALPATPTAFVFSVLADFGLRSPVPITTKLSDLGFDGVALAGLAADINKRDWHGVYVDTGAIQACTTVSDVIKVVAAAEK